MATLLRLHHHHPLQVRANPIPSPNFLPRNRRYLPSKPNVRGKDPTFSGLVSVPFALAESSDSPKSIDPASQSLLLELSVSFVSCLDVVVVVVGILCCVLNKTRPVCGNWLFFWQESFDLPSDYFSQLPNDLRLDVRLTLNWLCLMWREFCLAFAWIRLWSVVFRCPF